MSFKLNLNLPTFFIKKLNLSRMRRMAASHQPTRRFVTRLVSKLPLGCDHDPEHGSTCESRIGHHLRTVATLQQPGGRKGERIVQSRSITAQIGDGRAHIDAHCIFVSITGRWWPRFHLAADSGKTFWSECIDQPIETIPVEIRRIEFKLNGFGAPFTVQRCHFCSKNV